MSKELQIFKLKAEWLKGHIYAVYKKGIFHALEVNTDEPISDPKFELLKGSLYTEASRLFQACWQELKPRSVQDKLILFNTFYKHFRGTAYQPRKNEKANLANVPVTEALLKTFFTSQSWWIGGNYTIGNYVYRINNLKDETHNGEPKKTRHPDKWDAQYEAKLPNAEKQEYWKHLRELGYKAVHTGMATAWVKQ